MSSFFAGLESLKERLNLSGIGGRIPLSVDTVRFDRTGIDRAKAITGYPYRKRIVHNYLP